MDSSKLKYIAITPARNEENFLGHTFASVVAQTVRPERWIIVDDGSTDKTLDIATEMARQHSWIRVIQTGRNGRRLPGTNVVRAFLLGLTSVDCDFQFIAKLDADLDFPPDYFERLLERFARDQSLGICGGYCATVSGGGMEVDESPEYHVRGATKVYRRQCYDHIGGLMPVMGWDGLDEMKAMMLGWKTRSYRDLIFFHRRSTGSETGLLRYAWMWGRSTHFMGYHPIFLFGSSLAKFRKRPLVLFGCMILLGYLYSVFTRKPQIPDQDLKRFIRKFQRERIRGTIAQGRR